MTRVTKLALGAAVLVVALIVALLTTRDGQAPAKTSGDLTAARTKAALAPCPPPGPGEVAKLRGVDVECLGDGSRVDLAKVVSGGPMLVNLWASWCEPCRAELPLLQRYATSPGAARVLLVQVASSGADGLAMLAELGVRLPSVFDGDGQSGPVRTALKVPSSLPATYLVTAGGDVRLIENPRVFLNTDQVRAAVEGTP
ncbi:Conserved putative secreted protein [Amycolatopsis japonica]|uniref:Conserved putative secreted protein n=1 Tax=Amycolatopsis japonica TaxID=208439 RepID=A0A075V8B4_9PSEU|nr:TlpA disulfide reductase family protein [Amycolatopsis japonica]AIG80724.1 Conserved putative secreted protein [Amycolatopsis japonica]